MSAADEAYKAAVEEIERVRAAGGVSLDLAGANFHALKRLPDEIAGWDVLQRLYLTATQISVSSLEHLSGLAGLKVLWLSETQITDAGLEHLAGLRRLQILYLRKTQISDAGLAHLARLVKLKELDLRHTQISDKGLGHLAGLAGLQLLWLYKTRISDAGLAHLTGLAGLRRLDLENANITSLDALTQIKTLEDLDVSGTKVRDLRPICDLPLSGGVGWGLRFVKTPAAALDPKLEQLAEMPSDAERTEKTLAYLRSLPKYPAPLPWLEREDLSIVGKSEEQTEPNPPEQDPALPLIWGEKGFTFLANRVDVDEVTEAALDDLRAMLDDLRRKGNRHDDLYRLAGELQDRCKGEIADLSMVKMHISYQKLRRLYDGREGRAEGFDDETVGVLGSVLGIVPAVTLADPAVKVLIERQEADRLTQKEPETTAAERGVLNAITDEDAPFADEVQDAAKAILEPNQQDRLAATGGILARNSFVTLFRFLRHDPLGAGLTSGAVILFAQNHGQTFLALAQALGSDALLWAQMVLASVKAEAQIATGIAREVADMGAAVKPIKRKDTKE